MLKILDDRLMSDYYFLKDKGDDLKIYQDEAKFVPHKDQVINCFDQIVLGKNLKVPIIKDP